MLFFIASVIRKLVFKDTPDTENDTYVQTLSLHDALPSYSLPKSARPASPVPDRRKCHMFPKEYRTAIHVYIQWLPFHFYDGQTSECCPSVQDGRDRKSTRLNSSH